MALRLIEIHLPKEQTTNIQELLKDHEVLGIWHETIAENQILVKVLLDAGETEPILDLLEKHFSMHEGFRIILIPVEASIPRPKAPEKKPPSPNEGEEEEAKKARVSREELYDDISDSAKLSKVYVIMVAISSVVAAIGMIQDNLVLIIGAMLIAPLLGPNVALSLATTLADRELARNALKASIVGVFVTLLISVGIGLLFPFNTQNYEITSRTAVDLGDVVLALASGSAGAFAFTSAVPAMLTGVMLSVALLPPLVAFGLLMGSGNSVLALGAMLLLFTNLICINLAGVLAFFIQGIRPRIWWEADKAKRATHIALFLWTLLLLILIFIILLSQRT